LEVPRTSPRRFRNIMPKFGRNIFKGVEVYKCIKNKETRTNPSLHIYVFFMCGPACVFACLYILYLPYQKSFKHNLYNLIKLCIKSSTNDFISEQILRISNFFSFFLIRQRQDLYWIDMNQNSLVMAMISLDLRKRKLIEIV
jgi:hypothetical protein